MNLSYCLVLFWFYFVFLSLQIVSECFCGWNSARLLYIGGVERIVVLDLDPSNIFHCIDRSNTSSCVLRRPSSSWSDSTEVSQHCMRVTTQPHASLSPSPPSSSTSKLSTNINVHRMCCAAGYRESWNHAPINVFLSMLSRHQFEWHLWRPSSWARDLIARPASTLSSVLFIRRRRLEIQ